MEYKADIPGLCPKKCSCDQCRAARKADPGYQAYLREKWAKEAVAERKRTIENAEEHARNGSIYGNHERRLREAAALSRGKGG